MPLDTHTSKYRAILVLSNGLDNYKKRKLSNTLLIKEQKPSLNKKGQLVPLKLLNSINLHLLVLSLLNLKMTAE